MPGSADLFVDVRDVTFRYGAAPAVKNVCLSVPPGSIYGLIGSDGAGKSTLLRIVAGLLRPETGAVFIAGLDMAASRRKIKPLIGYMPQRFGLYQDLTVDENMDFFMAVFGIRGEERKRRRERYLGFSNLLPFADRPAGRLSGGMKQKLGLACVLVHEPRLLILDEPTNGVDPVSRREFWEILAQMRETGMTMVVSTAYLDEGERCDRIGLLHRSVLLDTDMPAAIRGSFGSLEEAIVSRIQAVDEDLAGDHFQ